MFGTSGTHFSTRTFILSIQCVALFLSDPVFTGSGSGDGNWSSTTHYYMLSISKNFTIYFHDFVIHWPRELSFREKFTSTRKHIDSIELEVKTVAQSLCSSYTSESTDKGGSYGVIDTDYQGGNCTIIPQWS